MCQHAARVGAATAMVVLAGCAWGDEDAGVLRDGACARHDVLLQAVTAMQDDEVMSGERRDHVIDFHHERLTDEAVASRELERSSYGGEFTTYWEQVELGLVPENARDHGDASGPDWGAIEDEGRELAGAWGCERLT